MQNQDANDRIRQKVQDTSQSLLRSDSSYLLRTTVFSTSRAFWQIFSVRCHGRGSRYLYSRLPAALEEIEIQKLRHRHTLTDEFHGTHPPPQAVASRIQIIWTCAWRVNVKKACPPSLRCWCRWTMLIRWVTATTYGTFTVILDIVLRLAVAHPPVGELPLAVSRHHQTSSINLYPTAPRQIIKLIWRVSDFCYTLDSDFYTCENMRAIRQTWSPVRTHLTRRKYRIPPAILPQCAP